jgi:hypothetical protein
VTTSAMSSITTSSTSRRRKPPPAIEDIKSKVPADKLRGYISTCGTIPGGLLDQSISVSDAFLERGEIVSDPRPQRRGDAALERPRPAT